MLVSKTVAVLAGVMMFGAVLCGSSAEASVSHRSHRAQRHGRRNPRRHQHREVAPHWVGAWEGSPESGGSAVSNQSFRLLVHTSIGGSVLRLRFANDYGTKPLTISDVTIGLPSDGEPGPSVDASTMHPVGFASGKQLTIPVGRDAYSLPVRLAVPGDAWLSVSFYVPGSYPSSTFHSAGWATSYEGTGDQANDPAGSQLTTPTISWTYLTGVDVVAPHRVSTVVALGDSITDCCISVPDANMRWPDILDQRLAAAPGGQRFSVVDAGISGNDVSNDRGGNTTQGAAGDTRDVRDVFDEPNVSSMILFEGINDIGTGVDATHITAAYQKILAQAHARGIRVIISTLTPSMGSVLGAAPGPASCACGLGYTTNAPVRDQVNSWIDSNAGLFDGRIDFASVVANPAEPDLWNPIYSSGDQLHPNQLGLKAMADSIPLSLFWPTT
jgi:lysophospholipase L1-like esterase